MPLSVSLLEVSVQIPFDRIPLLGSGTSIISLYYYHLTGKVHRGHGVLVPHRRVRSSPRVPSPSVVRTHLQVETDTTTGTLTKGERPGRNGNSTFETRPSSHVYQRKE